MFSRLVTTSPLYSSGGPTHVPKPDQHALGAAEAALAVAARMLGRSAAAGRQDPPSEPAPPDAPTAARALRRARSEPALRDAPTRAPAGSPRHVAEALQFLGMPLDVFQCAGASLEVRVPWLDVTLWMVPTDRDVAGLMAEGIRRGRIWTAAELMDLMAIAERTPETVKTVTHAKLEMDGGITEVRPRVGRGAP